jgi:hypothetical protein
MLIGSGANDRRARKPTCAVLPFPFNPLLPYESLAVRLRRAVLPLAIAVAVAADANAQLRPQAELRVDVLGPEPHTVQPGAGATVSIGTYARASAVVGYALQRDTNQLEDRWRADLLGRFLFDPFRQQRWAIAVGGGVSIRRRTYLVALVELEGPEAAGWLPAVHVGVSGGFRGGLVFRRAVSGRR